MKVLITGDSHTGALQQGLNDLLAEDAVPAALDLRIKPLGQGLHMTEPFFEDAGGYARITQVDYRRNIPRLPLEGETLVYGLSANLHTTRVWRHEGWSRFAPAAIARDETPVSDALLERVFESDQRYLRTLVELLCRNGVGVFAIESPYPFRHHRIFRSARAEVILDVDARYRRWIRGWMAEQGVPVVEVPAQCRDAEGFMLDDYRHDRRTDQHHGNRAFGRVMMQAVIGHLLTRLPPAAPGEAA